MASSLPTEAEVRALVSRIVAGLEPTDTEQPGGAAVSTAASDARSPGDRLVIALGADHGGYPLKERIGFRLKEQGHRVIDCGTDSGDSVDYPDFAHAVAQRVSKGEANSGVIVDGAGIGSAMAANKVPGVRAALCYDVSSAQNSREHNHANVLTLGAGLIGANLALQIVEAWLATPWAEGRHADRVAKITAIERQYSRSAR